MQPTPDVDALCKRYHDSDDVGRQQLFTELYTSHYHGPNTVPNELTKVLTSLVLASDTLPKKAGVDTWDVVIIGQVFSGMQCFCFSTPMGIDFAWDATASFVNGFKDLGVAQDGLDIHDFAVDRLKRWISLRCFTSCCDMRDVSSNNDVRGGDASVLSITPHEWTGDATRPLANLARNRKERRQCVVNKVIAARALRSGYADSEPGEGLFPGAEDLHEIEFTLESAGHRGVDGGNWSTSDIIAVTFQLRACAKTLLDILPQDGCEFPWWFKIADLDPGEGGRSDRIERWKHALAGFILGEKARRSDFEVIAYVSLALENLREPRDESSAELFSFENMVL